jgi:hypothetical protein
VYFFYPETAYRSLEEMDSIFQKTHRESNGSFLQPLFNIVKIAKTEPCRYSKNGEVLINYEETEEHREAERRRSSVVGGEKRSTKAVENTSKTDPGDHAENGFAGSSSNKS